MDLKFDTKRKKNLFGPILDHHHLSYIIVFIVSNLIYWTFFIEPWYIDYHYLFKTIQAIYRILQEFGLQSQIGNVLNTKIVVIKMPIIAFFNT